MSKESLSIIKCDNYSDAYEAIQKAIALLGGIEKFIKPGEKILIKPNLLAPKDPSFAVTTHPEIVRAVIKLVKQAGATPIVGDSPGGSIRDIHNLWKITGMRDVCNDESVDLVGFEAAGAQSIDIGDNNIKKVTFAGAVLDCDGIINLPKLKTHSLMSYSGGIKNFYGTIPGLLKVEYHKYTSKLLDFSALLSNIYLFLKPKIRLTIIDAVLAMDGNGPSAGNPKNLDFIAASGNTAILDAYLASSLSPDLIKHPLFKKLQITKLTLKDIEVLGDFPKGLNVSSFKFPAIRVLDKLPKALVIFLGSFLWVKPKIDEYACKKCLVCGKVCPMKAIYMNKNNVPCVNRKMCISCFCCHEMCPYKAIRFKKSFLARLFIQDDRK
jgi:uncharacterized protein (DUF362 family)/NAD-dependent dihydropyrimidine dehydrogenase PreA subunit